jgi:hypothetical protein
VGGIGDVVGIDAADGCYLGHDLRDGEFAGRDQQTHHRQAKASKE